MPRGDERSCSNTYQIAPDKYKLIVDMSSLHKHEWKWQPLVSGHLHGVYLSEEVAATYVMQHSAMRALVAKTDIIEVYRIVSRTSHLQHILWHLRGDKCDCE